MRRPSPTPAPRAHRAAPLLAALSAAVLLGACGGGGDSAAIVPGSEGTPAPITDANIFGLFPNPLLDPDTLVNQSDTVAYANAYYAAIDPTNAKDTLAKWKAANGFGTAAGALGEVQLSFGDVRDLGYGRRMTGRQNADGTIAFFVENYNVELGGSYAYSSLNVEAAVAADSRWHIGTNAIEVSPGPDGGVAYAKFYTFAPDTGARLTVADLDGRGDKALPGICINCHGGRMDPLTPTGLFPRVENARSVLADFPATGAAANMTKGRGDVTGKLQMFKVDDFDFSSVAGSTRTALEAKLKLINQMVLCSYVKPAADVSSDYSTPAPVCTRPGAVTSDWQGDAAEYLKATYGGNGMASATYSDSYVPSTWAAAGQSSLYNNVVKPYCATCHSVRGTGNQNDISFLTYSRFQQYAPEIRKHVYRRGNMPLARLVYADFWADTAAPKLLADWLLTQDAALTVLRDGSNKPIAPGRPVADPGPDRVIKGATALDAGQSSFASSYAWTVTGGSATLTGANTATPTFTPTGGNGSYTVQLTASNAGGQSDTATLTLVVDSAITDPATLTFTNIKTILQAGGAGNCVSCHTPAGSPKPPLFYTDFDRDGSGGVDATDEDWFYAELRGRINFTDVAASPLLRKPAGHHHGGNAVGDFDDSLSPGAAGRAEYDTVLNWILNGAPR